MRKLKNYKISCFLIYDKYYTSRIICTCVVIFIEDLVVFLSSVVRKYEISPLLVLLFYKTLLSLLILFSPPSPFLFTKWKLEMVVLVNLFFDRLQLLFYDVNLLMHSS